MLGNTNAQKDLSFIPGQEIVNLKLTLDGQNTNELYGANLIITDNNTGVSQELIYSDINKNVVSIDAGHSYTIKCLRKGILMPPEDITYTSINGFKRNVVLDYYTAPLGIYILTLDEKFVKAEDYTGGISNAIGVYVGTEQQRLVFSNDEIDISSLASYNSSSKMTNLYGHLYDTFEEASQDFDGEYNTSRLADATSIWSAIANYTFPNGIKGFVPALGQALIYYDNISEIYKCRKAINKDYVQQSTYKYLFTSTGSREEWGTVYDEDYNTSFDYIGELNVPNAWCRKVYYWETTVSTFDYGIACYVFE